jgi:hypothetical protein
MSQVMMDKAPRQFVAGHMSALYQFVSGWLPGWMRDWILARRFGLDKPAMKYIAS